MGLYWRNWSTKKRSRLWTSEQWRERTRTTAIYMRTMRRQRYFQARFHFLASTDAKTMHNRTWGDDFTRSLPIYFFEAEERGKVKTKGESRTSESSLQIAVDNTSLHDLRITYRYSVLSTSMHTNAVQPCPTSPDVMPSSPAPTYLSFAVYSKLSKDVIVEDMGIKKSISRFFLRFHDF